MPPKEQNPTAKRSNSNSANLSFRPSDTTVEPQIRPHRSGARPRRWLVMSAAGTELAVAVILFVWLGSLADLYITARWTDIPVATLLGAPVGFSVGLINLVRMMNWANREDESDSGENSDV